jgi:LytS/YehU family sensor histidine kinase
LDTADLDRSSKAMPASLAAGQARRAAEQLGFLCGCAIVLALMMSTQFLFQPFIWRNFDLSDILPAWISILRDRLVVAMFIAAALALLGEKADRSLPKRMTLQMMAIVGGAVAGELLLQWITTQNDRQDALSFAGRIVRWTLVGGSIAALIYFWRAGSEFVAAAENARVDDARLRRVAASTKLEMLKRQIEPHFLFNTLATIKRLQQTEPARSQQLLTELFDYMSATLDDRHHGDATLGDEVRLVSAYLQVCAARMTGALNIRSEISSALERSAFPPLILATLAENAIKHGIDPSIGGEIVMRAEVRGDMVAVTLCDTGIGFSEKPGGSGIGLANISERLRLLYGPAAKLILSANSPRGVCATILVPHKGATA